VTAAEVEREAFRREVKHRSRSIAANRSPHSNREIE